MHLMIYENENLVAYCRMIPPGITFKEHCIGRVCTKLSFRKTGLGFELMQYAIKWMKDNWAVGTIRISAQAYLLNFYNSLGFEKVSEQYLEDNIPHYEMLWSK